MRIQKVVMVGFSERTKFIFAPLVKQLYRVESFVSCRTIEDLAEHTDMVDSLFVSASYLGFECDTKIAQIRNMRPRVQIVVLAMHSMSNFIGMYLIRSGVDILFANVDDSNEFMKLQAAVENNLKYYPPNVREAFNDSSLNTGESRIKIPARETECLNLTMKGFSVKEIAEEMNISIGSVGNLRKRTMHRIGAHSFIELVHLAFIYTFSTKGDCEYVV
jgi:DNA-binding CsgD family transcriptional regulator